ncbi:MAG: transposase [Gammaproteobacteria bacterium]|jgi:transposase
MWNWRTQHPLAYRVRPCGDWSAKHLHWLSEIILPHPTQQIVIQEYLHTISERISRLDRLDN